MKLQWKRRAVLVAAIAALAGLATPPAQAQTAGKYLAPKDQVVANFGQPTKVVKLGTKEIDYYPDMKVVYTNGKVSDVQ